MRCAYWHPMCPDICDNAIGNSAQNPPLDGAADGINNVNNRAKRPSMVEAFLPHNLFPPLVKLNCRDLACGLTDPVIILTRLTQNIHQTATEDRGQNERHSNEI